MTKHDKALNQMCLYCKTNKTNCHKAKCNRYNILKNRFDLTELTEKELHDLSRLISNELSLRALQCADTQQNIKKSN